MKYLLSANMEGQHVSYRVLPIDEPNDVFWIPKDAAQKKSAVVCFDTDENDPIDIDYFNRFYMTVYPVDENGNPDYSKRNLLSMTPSTAKKISDAIKRASSDKNEI